MNILIKGDTCNKIIKIGTKRIPEYLGLPVIENIITNKIMGYAWFNCIDKTSRKDVLPTFQFHHFKIKP